MFSVRKSRGATQPLGLIGLLVAALVVLSPATTPKVSAQAPATRYLGTITAISGDTLTVKTDAGDEHQVQVPSSAQLKRIEPGQTNLNNAQPLEFSSLATGDRVLVNLDPNVTSGTPQAVRVVAIKHADVAKMQQAEIEAWNQGVHGLVKSVDPATGVIVVSMRVGTTTKDVTVDTGKSTVLKRYAPGSVRFDEAQPAPIGAIQKGDQLWARGTKSPDGNSMTAEGVVSGTFRSIPGTILSVDASASTVSVKDLAAKKPVTVHIAPDSQLRQLDPNIATMLAMRVKGNAGGPGGPGMRGGMGGGGATRRPFNQAGGAPGAGGGAPGAGGGRMDMESILDRAPAIQISSLKKGDAVMIVATEDTSGLSAIKLLSGVEPLLEAPEAQDLLSSWSLDQGSPDAGQ